MPPKRQANTETLEARRRVMRNQRNSPEDLVPRRLIIRPQGQEIWQPPVPCLALGVVSDPVPTELWFRLSEPANQGYTGLADQETSWNFTAWLDAVKDRWAQRKITVHFVSFDPVSIKTELFDRLRAMKDRAMPWPTRLLTDGKNITSTATLDQILASSLDEIQVYVAGLGEPTISPRVLEAIKDLRDLREARQQTHPIITCRLCPSASNGPKMIADMSQWVKQVGIDRLDVTDKITEENRLWR